MNKFMKIVIYVFAAIGLACIVKHLMQQECCSLCGWQKPKVEDVKTKEKDENKTGSRYGSNPVRY